MKNKFPKISIITPSYNQADFLEETIQSVLNQEYPNLEYIIIDGGSTDTSVDIIKKYEKHLDFWVSEKDNGQSDAINKGLNRATGDILTWLNSDDYLLPGALNTISRQDWGPETGAVVGIGHKVDLQKQIIYTPPYYEPITTTSMYLWTKGKNFMQPAAFFSKKAWDTCGPLNENLHYCMDGDLFIKISKQFKIRRVRADLAHAYAHDLAKTTADREKMFLEIFLMIASHGGVVEARELLFDYAERLKSDQIKASFLKRAVRKMKRVLKGTK